MNEIKKLHELSGLCDEVLLARGDQVKKLFNKHKLVAGLIGDAAKIAPDGVTGSTISKIRQAARNGVHEVRGPKRPVGHWVQDQHGRVVGTFKKAHEAKSYLDSFSKRYPKAQLSIHEVS